MTKNRVIVLSVIESGLRASDAARRYGVSRRWVEVLVARYHEGGWEAVEPVSRAPHHHPNATPVHVVDRIITLRQQLDRHGEDAGAETISMRLEREGLTPPSRATIHRILRAHQLVTPQPQKRPAQPGTASKPTSPTRCGRRTSPTGPSPTAPTSRS